MVEIVKNLNEAREKGLISTTNQKDDGLNGIGKIINDVKVIMEKFADLKGVNKTNNQEITQDEEKKNIMNNSIQNKIPIAVLEINDEEVNKLISEELEKTLKSPYIKEDMTVKQLIHNLKNLRMILKPEIKKFIKRATKTRIEYK